MRMMLQRQRGFTLVEVLLAIALVALIMAMAYGGFQASVRSTASGEALIEKTNRLRVTHQFIRRQLSLALALTIEEDRDGEHIRFEGGRDFVRFVAPLPGYLSYGGPYVQELRLERGSRGGELVFYYALLNGYEPGDLDQSEGIVLIDGLGRGEFSFLDTDEDGEDTFWDSLWDEPGVVPLAVSLSIELEDSHGLEWPDLVTPLRIDAGGVRAARSRTMHQVQPGGGLLRNQ